MKKFKNLIVKNNRSLQKPVIGLVYVLEFLLLVAVEKALEIGARLFGADWSGAGEFPGHVVGT